MKTRSSQYSGSLLVVTAIALTTPTITGCTAGLYAAQLIPTAIAGYHFLPGNASVELSQPGRGALGDQLSKVRSVMTDNHYSQEYLENERGLFERVALAKTAPLSIAGAAKMARQNGFDAFLMVDTGGPTASSGLLSARIIYGSASVQLISKDGQVLYRQTATLSAKANSADNPTERQVAEALAHAIVSDIKETKHSATDQQPKEPGLLERFKKAVS